MRRLLSSAVRVRNTLKDSLTSLSNSDCLKWYACGPTVYDVAHIGHARTYVCTDIIRRILLHYFFIPVNFALGVTDIDDKIIDKAASQGHSNICEILDMARNYEQMFFEDMKSLNVMQPDAILRVSEHIDDILAYIANIETSGHTYRTKDGIYFDVNAFESNHKYGKLGPIPSDNAESSNQICGKDSKKSPRDFALWKFVDSDKTAATWPSPWGAGRPGWHIECSAMTHANFGTDLDIHSGGIDLKFPHHTNEIAQW